MPAEFDWRAEDDRDWNEHRRPDAAVRGPLRRRRWAKIGSVIAIALILLLAGAFQLRRLANAAATAAEQEVRAAHELLLRALNERDLELMASLLRGGDSDWAGSQLLLVDQGLFLDRPAFGLTRPDAEPATRLEVELAPDLEHAEVTATFLYQMLGNGGELETVALKQTAVFGRDRAGWLLAAPDAEFWGQRMASSGRYLKATFHERDAVIANRLAGDLEATLARACNTLPGLACADDLYVELNLAIDPATLASPADQPVASPAEANVILPTPTLLGLPAEEGAYRALFRGYAARMLELFIGRAAGIECCPGLLQQALLDVQLRQLGLRPWPLTAEAYGELFRQGVAVQDLERLWAGESLSAEDESDRRWAYALAEYLLSPPATSAGDWLPLLATASLEEWLAATGESASQVVAGWQRLIRAQVVASQLPPGVDLPAQDILLMCSDAQRGAANIYRHDPSRGTWTVELADREFAVMEDLPNDVGALLTEHFVGEDLLRTIVYLNQQEFTLMQGDTFLHSAGQSDPAGRLLALFSVGRELLDGQNSAVLDLASCAAAGCDLWPLVGTPHWSPDASRTLLVEVNPRGAVYLADGTGRGAVFVAAGHQPLWLNESVFAYLADRPEDELVIRSLDGASEQTITADDVAALIDPDEPPLIALTMLLDSPAPDELLYLIAEDRLSNRSFVLAYDWVRGDLETVFVLDPVPGLVSSAGFSPDGRWLLLTTEGWRGANMSAGHESILIDVAEGSALTLPDEDSRLLPVHDWSADGRWLLKLGEGFLLLYAPDEQAQRVVDIGFPDCTAAIWVNGR